MIQNPGPPGQAVGTSLTGSKSKTSFQTPFENWTISAKGGEFKALAFVIISERST
jgi:hypothetical protein